MVVLNVSKKLALVLGIAIVCLGGCTKRPTNEQLEVLRKQASDRNNQILAEQSKNNQEREWSLVIQGETANDQPVTLNWQQIRDFATEDINTIDANNIITPEKVFKFTGISVNTLLKKVGTQPGVTEITFVCYDAYQVTVKIQDLVNYPIILAVAKDGKPIERDQGGPIYLVFPYTQHPQLRKDYNEGMWAFYVTHIIVGTEEAQVRVGKRKFSLNDLDQLPQVTLTQNVGYRVWWPSGEVKVHGVRVRDVLSLAGVPLTTKGSVFVRGKPIVYHKASEVTSLPAKVIQDCDILLVTRWGNGKQQISARMGGPVTLAFSDKCQAKTQQLKWVTFVEELTIQP
ncbi:molybdopterin-dependent oxidoreductase [Sphaerospermopsis aphanizomenoides BCCUSP55]|uniref:molybdopterin-dependent oxidoreductase n=1 Tax=Sphaerospermopsis aphanizomenoides TaxID=459663 RepID=UPI000AB93FD6|nr:molybdopterin-dependent oxidoreductase [Sphaerospermopsis aphanizomenoides]MBK1988548.1 molybdopterin-dependent oxidoreductase [Sphaerospermopsis aphanizomenoides BCCUSP55]